MEASANSMGNMLRIDTSAYSTSSHLRRGGSTHAGLCKHTSIKQSRQGTSQQWEQKGLEGQIESAGLFLALVASAHAGFI